jgi:hypothetical protein
MKNDILEDLIIEKNSLKKNLLKVEKYQKELNIQLNKIQKARSYKLWQTFNKLKKIYLKNNILKNEQI